MASDKGHQAFWTITRDGKKLKVTFRQGEEVQDCGDTEAEDDLIGWLFLDANGAQQYDYIQAPGWQGHVMELNCESN